jgi:hypothetical protein
MTLMIWMMTQMKAALTWTSGFPKMEVMIGIESSSLSLMFRFRNKRTKPLTFSHAVGPMNAYDWLKSIEKKLQVVQCNNNEEVLLASHQLSGRAAD